jgi:hypothetical protein
VGRVGKTHGRLLGGLEGGGGTSGRSSDGADKHGGLGGLGWSVGVVRIEQRGGVVWCGGGGVSDGIEPSGQRE